MQTFLRSSATPLVRGSHVTRPCRSFTRDVKGRGRQYALMVLLSRVEQLAPDSVANRKQLLHDLFTGNLNDLHLRWDIKCWQREHPTKTFQQIMEEVQRWVDEDGRPPQRSAVACKATIDNWRCGVGKKSAPNTKPPALNEKAVEDVNSGSKRLPTDNHRPIHTIIQARLGGVDVLCIVDSVSMVSFVMEELYRKTLQPTCGCVQA